MTKLLTIENWQLICGSSCKLPGLDCRVSRLTHLRLTGEAAGPWPALTKYCCACAGPSSCWCEAAGHSVHAEQAGLPAWRGALAQALHRLAAAACPAAPI